MEQFERERKEEKRRKEKKEFPKSQENMNKTLSLMMLH